MKKINPKPTLIVKMIIAGVILATAFYLFTLLDTKATKKAPIPNLIPTMTDERDIRNEISYEMPLGWKELYEENSDMAISLVSHDYVDNGGFGKNIGIFLTIRKSVANNPDKNLDEIINHPSGAFGFIESSTIEELNIGGKRAVKYDTYHEGRSQEYLIASKDAVWLIDFYSNTGNLEAYQQDIENFILSIKFNN